MVTMMMVDDSGELLELFVMEMKNGNLWLHADCCCKLLQIVAKESTESWSIMVGYNQ